ncbi:hypothetical protein C4K24_3822 [Pseudomonas chlororaphis subsp. aurantiaca]|uniref:DUF2474 domain-containing protein n=1 Tax=Pseudomonas chlororaphis TaxID=587753 RepID=UPI000F5881AA|nr:DUF2474 domain-containing protein [Pseudomonas chlororaphis]AZD23122.1 hypothetical protein C4K24_3822 [Pseudomonas chlororaphis subsp. aurantiaca]
MERSEVSSTEGPAAPWYRRLAWLVGIWFGSVLALGAVAGLLRLMMQLAGMSTH